MHRRGASSCHAQLAATHLIPTKRVTGCTSLRYQSSSSSNSNSKRPAAPPRPRRPFTDGDWLQSKKYTKKLVDHSLKRDERGWSRTPSLRGAEMALKGDVVKAQKVLRARGPSLEKMSFMAGEDVAEGCESSESLAPGTFVEALRNEISTLGLVLGEIYQDRQWRVSVLMTSGEVWRPLRDDIMFAVPNVASADLASRCGQDELASTPGQLHARVEALKRIRAMEKAVEDAHNRFCQKGLDVYSIVKSSDVDKWTTTTVVDVARLVYPEPDVLARFATHRFLMNRSDHFVAHHAYRNTLMFDVRPQNQVKVLETVRAWTRVRDGPIDRFAEKARGVIERNKKVLAEGFSGIPSQRPADHTWTDDDRVILEFLLHSLRPARSTQVDPYALGQSTILKRIDPQYPYVNDHAVHQTLIDLGVLAPWQDLTILRPDLGLDLTDETSSSRVQADNALVERSMSSRPSPGAVLGPEDFHTTDPLEAVRHDFGDMRVYVIDDPSAEELDDGISIEQVPSEPGSHWVHVHVADPASLLHPGHVFSKQASQQGETAYFLQRSWPLFPRSLMHSETHGLSLGARSASDAPERVLSFSAKIDGRGEIVDSKVRAGLVRNIHKITYDRIDLDLRGSLIKRTYPFGGAPPVMGAEPLPKDQRDNLVELALVAKQLVNKRMRDGIFIHSESKAEITGFARVPSTIESPTLQPSHFSGFPGMSYMVLSTHDMDMGARNIVAEMMKVACRVASRFCLEKNVPVIRRVAGRVVAHSDSDHQKILDARTPNGYVFFHDVLPYIALNPAAGYSLEPKEHFGLGVAEGEGYVRVTSPLRRYTDLVAHWQIHHALLGSATPLPFSPAVLQEMTMTVSANDRLRKRLHGVHDRFWHLTYLKRWMEMLERGEVQGDNRWFAELEGYTLLVPKLNTNTRGWQTEVHVPVLGLRGLLEGMEVDVLPATKVPVEVTGIRLGTMPQIQLRPRT